METSSDQNDLASLSFNNPTCGNLDGSELIDELASYVNDAPQKSYLLTVGTDSCHVDGRASIVSVIAVQRVGHGGRYFWRRFYDEEFPSLRQRIYREATLSLKLASRLNGALEQCLDRLPTPFNYNLQIHVDIGHSGPTGDMMNEIVGMIRGSGYEVRTKPEAYCAAVVADRYA
ncbi:MAG: ribonuclease H-like YkuK family protein [bacterium]